MHDIFLSYSTADLERLKPLANALMQQGWSVFWDHEAVPIGKHWQQVIGQAIRSSRCVLVVWSESSVESEWVLEEALEGKRRGVLLPIAIDEVEIPFGFGINQAGNFVGWNGKADHPEFRRLAGEIRLLLGEETGVASPEIPSVSPDPQPLMGSTSSSSGNSAAFSGLKVFAGVGVLAALGFGGYQYFQEDGESVQPAKLDVDKAELAKPVVESKPGSVKPKPPATYTITVKAVPVDAMVTVDGKAYQASDKWRAGTYTVRAEAKGYKPREGKVAIETSDIEVSLELEVDRLPFEPEMVDIPAGEFLMGCDPKRDDVEGGCASDEKPAHKVSISKFKLAKTEVTVEQFRTFMEATNYKTTAEKKGSCWSYDDKGDWSNVKGNSWKKLGFKQEDNHPVACVSWDDAKAYVSWLKEETGKEWRLPTEAEWEYAARAGTSTAYPWSNSIGKNNANCHGDLCGDSFKFTSPVASFTENPFGLYDMHGNVWEWVEDHWHSDYKGAPSDGAAWLTGGDSSPRVFRGGSWPNNPQSLRSANRNYDAPDFRRNRMGFRLAQGL